MCPTTVMDTYRLFLQYIANKAESMFIFIFALGTSFAHHLKYINITKERFEHMFKSFVELLKFFSLRVFPEGLHEPARLANRVGSFE